MRPTLCILLLGMGLGVCGCDSFHGPPLAISTAADDTGSKQTSSTSTKTPGPPRPPTNRPLIVYNGHTVEQWAQLLQSADRQQVFEACQALTVLGYEGRYLLFQGLESPHAETHSCAWSTWPSATLKNKERRVGACSSSWPPTPTTYASATEPPATWASGTGPSPHPEEE